MSEPKKLFEVELTATLYVVADDLEEAEQVGREAIVSRDFDATDEGDVTAYQVRTSAALKRSDWAKALPFGGEGRLTCADYLSAWEEYERTRPATAKELEAAGQQPLLTPEAAA